MKVRSAKSREGTETFIERSVAEVVPQGFKRTEIGLLPAGWDVRTIGELFEYKRTSSFSRSDLTSSGEVAYIHYGDIHTRFDHVVDFSDNDIPYLKPAIKTSATRLRDGDLIIADASEDEIGVGKCVEVRNLDGIDAVGGLHTIVLRPRGDKFCHSFGGYILESAPVRSQLLRLATGLKVFGISKGALSGLLLPIPPKHEQRAIAEALSDVDELLEALDALIAKKRAIKKAAMQELLTGRTRLPGFSATWESKPISEFTECVAGGTPSTFIPEYWGGSVKWMSSGELHKKRIKDVEGRITLRGLRESSAILIPPASVLLGLAGQGKTRGTAAITKVVLSTNQSIAAILPNSSFNSEYLYHTLDSRYDELRGISTGQGGRGGLNLGIIGSIHIPFPPIKEQEAIAMALTDMDGEIAALEHRLEKTRQIKKGMMQQLLTGRVRLIESTPEVTAA